MVSTIDGGGGGRTGPFDRYQASPEAVHGAGDRIAAFAGAVEAMDDEVTSAHRPAQSGVAGLLADPMVAAERSLHERAQRWQQSALFAGGAVRLFGDAVAEFNRRVDDLNRRYWQERDNSFGLRPAAVPAGASEPEQAAQAGAFAEKVTEAERELLFKLRLELHQSIEPALDDEADHVARLLDRGPQDEAAVASLYAAGVLPATAPFLFPQHQLAQVPLQNLPDGSWLSDQIQRAMAGELPPEQVAELMLYLELMAARIEYVDGADGAYLTEAEVAFLHDFYNGMGEQLWELPGYIQAEEHRWGRPEAPGVPWLTNSSAGFEPDAQERMLSSLGAGLLALSDDTLWDPALRGQDPMDPASRYHLPEPVIAVASEPAIELLPGFDPTPYGGVRFPHEAEFEALAAMLGHAPETLQGGTRFSELTTLRVAEMAAGGSLNHELYGVSPEHTSMLETLLEVATRNEQANYNLLTNPELDPMVRPVPAVFGDDHRNLQLDDRQFLLDALYTYEWSDEGAAAAGLTDWISQRQSAAAAEGRYDPMATEAAAELIDLVTATTHGEGHGDDPRVDMYDRLMATFAERNPEIARSFSRLTAAYFQDFSNPSASPTRVGESGSLSLSHHDQVRFLDLIATDDKAIDGLSYASGIYQQRLLDAAHEGTISMAEAAQRSSRLDGLLGAARFNADQVLESQRYESEAEAFEQHMRYAGHGKSLGLGWTKAGPGPFFTGGLEVAVDELIREFIPPPEPAIGADPGGMRDIGRDETYAAHSYLEMLLRNDALPEDYDIDPSLIQELPDGQLSIRPIAELDGPQRDTLDDVAEVIGGEEFSDYKAVYNAWENFQKSSVDDAEDYRRGRW